MTTGPSSPLPSLLDTDIFSEFVRGRNKVVAKRAAEYELVHGHFTISAITLMEVASGWHRRGRQTRVDELLQRLVGWEVLPVDERIAVLAGRIHGDLMHTGQPVGVALIL